MSKKSRVISLSPTAPVAVVSFYFQPNIWASEERVLPTLPLVRQTRSGEAVYAYLDAYLIRVLARRGVPPSQAFIISDESGRLINEVNALLHANTSVAVFCVASAFRDCTPLSSEIVRLILMKFDLDFWRECMTVPRRRYE